MKNKYIEYLKTHHDARTAMFLQLLLSNGFVDEIQLTLNEMGEHLTVDSILGFRTLVAIDKHESTEFWQKLQDIVTNHHKQPAEAKQQRKADAQRTVIMNFLYQWEGRDIAWLKGEKAVTAPLGVYCYAMPNSLPCRRLRELYKQYGLNYHAKSHARLLDKKVTSEERHELFELAWDHYKRTYLGLVGELLGNYPKSSLAFFSNAINGGQSRGNKTLQTAVGATPDGKIGKGTKAKLTRYLGAHSDFQLQQGVLSAMGRHYCNLCTSRPSRFSRYCRGWFNRIKGIGYKGKMSCL